MDLRQKKVYMGWYESIGKILKQEGLALAGTESSLFKIQCTLEPRGQPGEIVEIATVNMTPGKR